MKRFLAAIALCLVCAIGYGQASWDAIGRTIKGSIVYDTFGKTTYVGTLDVTMETIKTTRYVYLDTINGGYSYENEFYETHPFGYQFVREWSVMKQIPTDTTFRQTATLPTCIYNRYKLGERLTLSGWINFGVGLGLSLIGGVLLTRQDGNIPQQGKVGTAFLGAGGALVSISIPQLCFGDHIKREANVSLQIYEQLQCK